MTARPSRWRRAGALLILGAFAFAGCSASDSSAPSAVTADRGNAGAPEAPGEVAAPEAPAPEGDAATGGGGQQQQVQIEERALIYTGQITVKVDDVAQRADQAKGIATGVGGVVGGDRRTLDGTFSEAQLVLRVPADRFNAALDELAKLGVEQSRAVQTEDVTEALVDLDARLATQRASVDRVRALLAQANTIGEVVSIESELTRREAELASLEQRRDRMAGLVALSTITANLRGPDASPAPDEPDTGFVAGLKSGWKAFLESIKILLTIAGWLLPWAIAIGVPIWLLIWFVRRRRRPVVVATSPTSTPAGPPPSGPPPAGPTP
jgi:hypothetical protein